jgi:hypothetical protein
MLNVTITTRIKIRKAGGTGIKKATARIRKPINV